MNIPFSHTCHSLVIFGAILCCFILPFSGSCISFLFIRNLILVIMHTWLVRVVCSLLTIKHSNQNGEKQNKTTRRRLFPFSKRKLDILSVRMQCLMFRLSLAENAFWQILFLSLLWKMICPVNIRMQSLCDMNNWLIISFIYAIILSTKIIFMVFWVLVLTLLVSFEMVN